MRYTLENDLLKVEIDSHGAELKSVINKETGLEYMWQADPKFWGRTSPILFPFVGNVVDGKYRFEGKEYAMSSHGFARDKEFDFASQTSDEIWFKLTDSEDTYVKYPFHFILELGYKLDGNALSLIWKVTNPGQDREDSKLYFAIGAHPAFNCPIGEDKDKVGYKLYFGDIDVLKHHGNLHGPCTRENLELKLDNHRANITPEFFDRSTYIAEGAQTGVVAIETPDGRAYVTVEFDHPLFAIWSPTDGNRAPFICIEPWYGRADYEDYTGELIDREYENAITPEEIFEKSYTVKFS